MENTERISALLHEAAETHHVVYRIVDGDDPDWASWYADWLVELSELPEILGANPCGHSSCTHSSSSTATTRLRRPTVAGKTGTQSVYPLSCERELAEEQCPGALLQCLRRLRFAEP